MNKKEGKGSKFGALIEQARKPENQKTSSEETQVNLAVPSESIQNQLEPDVSAASEPEVNLCVKVPVSWRRHWAAASKKEGITMTAVIIEALEAKFGKP